jgi:hypothetical protein
VSARTHAAYNKSVQDKVKMQKVLFAIAGGVQKKFLSSKARPRMAYYFEKIPEIQNQNL